MAELVGIKVIIGRVPTATGVKNLYPNFNRIHSTLRAHMDWSSYIDSFGSGWHYDEIAPFGTSDPESPGTDEMFGVIAVPEEFAREAVRLFPDTVSTVDEVEFTRLFETRTKSSAPDTFIDTPRLDQLRSRYGIVGPIDDPAALALMSPEDRRAVDPNDPAPGIVNNPDKTVSRYTQKTGHTIKPTPGFSPPPGPSAK
jgi:hypothetical protein